jgi:hypothetical protein
VPQGIVGVHEGAVEVEDRKPGHGPDATVRRVR